MEYDVLGVLHGLIDGKIVSFFFPIYSFLTSLTQVAPIISGAMADHIGWRSFWWLNTALLGASLLMVIFMFPETRWHRKHPDEIASSSTLNQDSPASSTEKMAAAALEKTSDIHVDEAAIRQAPTSISAVLPELGFSEQETAARDPYLGKGTPSKQQWRLFQPNAHPFKSILLDLWIPWKLFAFPIVEFASFVVSWSCSSFLTINLTQSQAFAAPPYNFSSQSIGESGRPPLAPVYHVCKRLGFLMET